MCKKCEYESINDEIDLCAACLDNLHAATLRDGGWERKHCAVCGVKTFHNVYYNIDNTYGYVCECCLDEILRLT